jgi:hypothetical protein
VTRWCSITITAGVCGGIGTAQEVAGLADMRGCGQACSRLLRGGDLRDASSLWCLNALGACTHLVQVSLASAHNTRPVYLLVVKQLRPRKP